MAAGIPNFNLLLLAETVTATTGLLSKLCRQHNIGAFPLLPWQLEKKGGPWIPSVQKCNILFGNCLLSLSMFISSPRTHQHGEKEQNFCSEQVENFAGPFVQSCMSTIVTMARLSQTQKGDI